MRLELSAVPALASVLLIGCVANGVGPSSQSAELVGSDWVVEDISGRGVIDNAQTTIRFGSDGRVSGNTSCNRYFAGYEVNGSMLQIENPGVTRRACVPAVMDQEQRFLSVFNTVNSYSIDDTGTLTLSTPEGVTIIARR